MTIDLAWHGKDNQGTSHPTRAVQAKVVGEQTRDFGLVPPYASPQQELRDSESTASGGKSLLLWCCKSVEKGRTENGVVRLDGKKKWKERL